MSATPIYSIQKSQITNEIKKVCKGSKLEILKFSFLTISEATAECKA